MFNVTIKLAPRHIRVFLSSPGDILEERASARLILSRLPYDPFLRGKITIEIVAWDEPGAGVPMLANVTPQEAVNQGLPMPAECDIVVVIFWTRMGTPLQFPLYTKPDGTQFLSGTEWEYYNAMQAAHKTAMPKILVYRRTTPMQISIEAGDIDAIRTQYQRVTKFFSQFTDETDGSLIGGYNPYKDSSDFAVQFDAHVKTLIQQLLTTPSSIIDQFKSDLAQQDFLTAIPREKYEADFVQEFVMNRRNEPWIRAWALEYCFDRGFITNEFFEHVINDENIILTQTRLIGKYKQKVAPEILAARFLSTNLSVAKSALTSAQALINAGYYSSSLFGFAAEGIHFWEIFAEAVRRIIETDDSDSFNTLLLFRRTKYHITRKKIMNYFLKLHSENRLPDHSAALEILQSFVDDIESSDGIIKRANNTIASIKDI